MVREDFEKKIEERTKKGKIKTTKKGLNQEVLFQRHDKLVLTIKNCGGWLVFFFYILRVLYYFESHDGIKRRHANGFLNHFYTFEFVFY